jgi:hypothetical protein
VNTGAAETVYNFEIEGDHTYFVGDPVTWGFSLWAHNYPGGAGRGAASRLKAGDSGSYSSLRARGRVGDGLTPHHMPQAAAGFTPYGEGGALALPHAGHVLTRTYGARGAITAAQEAGDSFRTVLARDIADVRNLFGGKYNQGLLSLLDYYRANFPQLMVK